MGNDKRTVVLIACSSRKLDRAARARELYQGMLFRASLAWAQSQVPDAICILSAKYGLVDLDQEIEPYDLTLNALSVNQVRAWSERVFDQLQRRFDVSRDRFVFLAGEKYRRFLVSRLSQVEVPLAGLPIGKQVSWLQHAVREEQPPQAAEGVAETCQALHALANSLPRHRFPLDVSQIPANGLYILFERGESGHGADRIVRIGTHTGDGNLPTRLREHFERENKDRSIFRKNIGRALLAADDDPLLKQWELDLTSRAARERYGDAIDRAALERVEGRVSRYMRDRFSFAVLEVSDREQRLALEKALIGTVAHCPECGPSASWPGRHSPVERIREGGLWLTQHLGARPMKTLALEALKGGSPVTASKQTPSTPSAARPGQRRKPGGKYGPLYEHLKGGPDVVNLSFAEIERVLGASLPASARDYRPWWANHDGSSKSPQSRAWQAAGFRVGSVRLGNDGSVQFVRAGAAAVSSKEGSDSTSDDREGVRTHGGRARSFEWSLEGGTVQIKSESGMSHAYSLEEILAVLRLLDAHFRGNWFPLANNVEKLYHGEERYGLGGAIHQQKPGDTLHAQGASYLGVALERAGVFEWNGKKREIEWRICQMPQDKSELHAQLKAADC
jgi:hypothetical protein